MVEAKKKNKRNEFEVQYVYQRQSTWDYLEAQTQKKNLKKNIRS
jgi:hypothetical protein